MSSVGRTRPARARSAAPSRSRGRARAPRPRPWPRAPRPRGSARARVGPLSSSQVRLDERALPRRERDVGRGEAGAHLLPERARLARPPVVVGGLAHEQELPPRPGAGGVEEVALALERVGTDEPAALPGRLQPAPRLVREERRLDRAAREDPSSRPRTNTASKRRVRARIQVEHRDAAGLGGPAEPHLRALERRDDLLRPTSRRRACASRRAREEAERRLVRAQVDPRRLSPTGGDSSP